MDNRRWDMCLKLTAQNSGKDFQRSNREVDKGNSVDYVGPHC